MRYTIIESVRVMIGLKVTCLSFIVFSSLSHMYYNLKSSETSWPIAIPINISGDNVRSASYKLSVKEIED